MIKNDLQEPYDCQKFGASRRGGDGIGGLAAALALVRQGVAVKVLEPAPPLGEIGAGIQLGPSAFAAFDARRP